MRATRSLTFAFASALALAGCSGSQGDVEPQGTAGVQGGQGPQGAQGPQGPIGPAYDGPTAVTSVAPWKFAVMSDTQWSSDLDRKNPNTVATDIIAQLNQEFIAKGVKLVVAVGDLSDQGCASLPCAPMQTRAAFAQALYNAGIAFYPLRGNHEKTQLGALEFQRLFPQTQNGVNNATPGDALAITFPAGELISFPARTGSTFTVGSSFSSPWELPGLLGLSYAFDHENVRFVLLDQFTPADNGMNSIDMQQAWIDRALEGRPAGGHAFVFGHKHLISDNHTDTLFGANPAADPMGQDAFIKALSDNGVHYYIGGHDHMHLDSVFTTVDGTSGSVHDLVLASDSYKFYTPINPSNDATWDVTTFSHARQTRISEELYQIGYYVFTVDGPRVTVEYFAVPAGYTGAMPPAPDAAFDLTTTPALAGNFTSHGTFGYSLNGKEFLVAQNASYKAVADSFVSGSEKAPTVLSILSGSNRSAATDPLGRWPMTKAIDTGWTPRGADTASDVLTLWGMGDLGADSTDTYAIQLSFDPAAAGSLTDGTFGVAIQDASGKWVNVVSKNVGGTAAFTTGGWTATPAKTLGSYGVDLAPNPPGSPPVAWAVVNVAGGKLAVARFAP
jgi:hypothetical protein